MIYGPHPRHPKNVDGDFFVEDGCCLECDVPWELAPNLIAYSIDPSEWGPSQSCFVCRQPANDDELRLMVRAMEASCVMCIHYRGDDPSGIEDIRASLNDLGGPASRRASPPVDQ